MFTEQCFKGNKYRDNMCSKIINFQLLYFFVANLAQPGRTLFFLSMNEISIDPVREIYVCGKNEYKTEKVFS